MSIDDIIEARGIEEILHFTTNYGILGILDTKCLKARQRLNVDARLEYIFTPNAAVRSRDAAWLDYVNLSISRINTWFATSSGKWHRPQGVWWCVLAFKPEILNHSGVYFTTTNNIYSSVSRASGQAGLEAMFSPKIVQYNSNIVIRKDSCPSFFTTCEQAEVLYPGQIRTEYLKKIYVPSSEIEDQVAGQLSAVGHPLVDLEVRESLFNELY